MTQFQFESEDLRTRRANDIIAVQMPARFKTQEELMFQFES